MIKLYTELEVIKAITRAQECDSDCGGVYFYYETPNGIIEELTPIELPSDEEIEEEEAEKRFPYEKHMGDTWGNGLHEGFFIGAKWMKEQILNQNK